jgi:predicted permease
MNRLRQWLLRRQQYRELSEELHAHLEEHIEELIASGMSPEQATRSAQREFGHLDRIERTSRDVWRWPSLEELLSDIRNALRALRRNLLFTGIAVVTIAIGIAANVAVFSVVNSVLLRPLDYPRSEELVALHQIAPGAEGLANFESGLLLSSSMYFTYSEHNRTLQSMGVWSAGSVNVTGLAEPEQVRAVGVSDGVFQTFAVPPAVGRWFSQADQTPNGPLRVMLSYGYWQKRFGGSEGVIGRSILVDSQPREIVGAMPRGFRFVDTDFDLAIPLALDRSKATLAGFGFDGVARRKPGVTIEQVDADLSQLLPIWMNSFSNVAGTDPHIYETWKITPAIRPLKQEVVGNVGELLWVVMGTIAVVLLIACANVTNLLLVRVESRQQELAVRAALGAGWKRIVRGLLVESVILGLIGGLVGVALAYAGVQLLVAIGPSNLPRLNEISLDARTLLFALLLSVLSGLLFGLIPALKYAGPRIAAALRAGPRTSASRERQRGRKLLIVSQVAMALVLLVSAGLMIRTFEALQTVDPGFADARHLQLVRISIPEQLVAEPERVTQVQKAIVDKLAAIPGAKSVGFISEMPMEGFDSNWDQILAEDRVYADNAIAPLRLYKYLSPGLLQAAGTRLVAGREMTWSEIEDLRPVVMISENLARELWGTPSAGIGKRVREIPQTPWQEIIGVVQDVREKGVQETAPAIVYWAPRTSNIFGPAPQNALRTATFVIHSERAETESFLSEVRDAVWSVNPELPVASVRTMQNVYDKSVARTSFTLVLLGVAAAMALALGIFGIYGVMSYTVSRRQRDIGVRLALGAQRRHVLKMVLHEGVKLALVGVTLGICASLLSTRLMTHLLFGVTAYDPSTYVAVSSLLILTALAACYIPARRATLINPTEAIRNE